VTEGYIHDYQAERAEDAQEYRIFGPPGTGKTTYLARQIERAVERVGPDAVLITSFSKAAAVELAGRDLPVAPERVGTLHSHCYRALGAPQLAEANVGEWNKTHPHWAMTPQKGKGRLDGEEVGVDEIDLADATGDELLEEFGRKRGMLTDESTWLPKLAEFAQAWTAYKEDCGYLDFTDLIDVALRDVLFAPHGAKILFADEAQDLNPMQMALIRRWGYYSDYFVVAGDDDQLLYAFAGCTADSLLNPPLPASNIIPLKQSWRIPKSVHTVAMDWIGRVSQRQPKEFKPREFVGEVNRHCQSENWTLDNFGGPVLRSIEADLAAGKKVMILASCSYLLQPAIRELRQAGLPFQNEYRKSNGAWNPIRKSAGSTAARVYSFLSAHPEVEGRAWTWRDLEMWTELFKSSGVLRRGTKKIIEAAANRAEEVHIGELDQMFEPAALEELLCTFEKPLAATAEWLHKTALKSQASVAYATDIATRRGAQALVEDPCITIGTIHSVKGGQADVVYLFPDLSRAGGLNWISPGVDRDNVLRAMYVGMTRARETLHLCSKSKRNPGVQW
jgi:DNA helicase II / ATP-dependent DNA helicase PcrA